MRNVISVVLLAFVMTFVTSCKEEKKEAPIVINEQLKLVMDIHDEVMPKMSKLGRLVGKLKGIEDSTEIGLQYKEARVALQDANKAMMDWMKQFGGKFKYDEIHKGKALTEQKLIWLDEEEVKVKALRDQINSSIARAEQLLGKK